MKLSKKWLLDFLDLEVDAVSFAEGMTNSGSKVEAVTHEGAELSNIVVGRVNALSRHPDSDHLWVCQVDIGGEILQIVTGAQNLTEGVFVPVAKHNSTISGGKKITKGKLRGVLSNGMLCSLEELSLSLHDFPYADEAGIFLLGEDCTRTLGLPIQEAIGLDDTVTEFEITSNRPDCLSVLGLAREAAATFHLPFVPPNLPDIPGGNEINSLLTVKISEPELCYRYMAAVVKNVHIAPSPRWMHERLRASGVRSINNVVDLTNFVMLEYGLPLHAFDYSILSDGIVEVRRARNGEILHTLDGEKRELSPDSLVISDKKTPLALAGIMGGCNSGITDQATTIFFEAACFQGLSIHSTSRRFGLRTEASARYEKELDPATCPLALRRVLQLVKELNIGDVVDGVVDVFPTPKKNHIIPFDPDFVNYFIGIECSAAEQIQILSSIGCFVSENHVEIPSFRQDLQENVDLAEEIARFFGYERIPLTPLQGLADGQLTQQQHYALHLGEVMRAQGCDEIATYSFFSPKLFDLLGLPDEDEARNYVEILNPLGETTRAMRTSALPSMLEALAHNYKNRVEEARLFELATTYHPREPGALPEEQQRLLLGCYGPTADFFAIKGIFEALCFSFHIKNISINAAHHPSFHPGRTAQLCHDGKILGILGQILPEVSGNFGISCPVYLCDLSFSELYAATPSEILFRALPRYPAVSRDLALLCPLELPVGLIQSTIRSASGKLLEECTLFDVYTGDQISEKEKSVAFQLLFRSPTATLTDREVDSIIETCLEALKKNNVSIRK